MELPMINEGRHYHSSCSFNDQFIYIFGGIQNQNKKYSGSVERMIFSTTKFNNPWEKLNLQQMPSLSLGSKAISAR